MRVSIRAKLIVAILVPLLAVYLGVLVINYQTGKRQAIDQAKKHLRELASHHAARLDARFVIVEQAVQSTADLVAEHEPTLLPRRLESVLSRAVTNNPVLYGGCVALAPREPDEAKGFARFVYRYERPKPARPPPKRPKTPGSTTNPNRPSPETQPEPVRKPLLPMPRLLRIRESLLGQDGAAPWTPVSLSVTLRRGDLAHEDPNLYEEPWYTQAKAQEAIIWNEPHREKAMGDAAVCRCSAPLFADDEFRGVAAFDIAVAPLQEYIARTKIEGGYCILVSGSGLLVAHPRKDLAMHQTLQGLADSRHRPELGDLAHAMTGGGSGVWNLSDPDTGQPSWVVYSPIPTPGWSFAAVIPESQIMGPVYDRLRHDMALMLGGLSVIIGLVLMVSFSITRPIRRLAPVVRRLADGDLDARVEGVRSRDEIGEFAGAFNQMVGDLKQHVEALTQATAAREAVESEMRVAREIQAALLPHNFPPFPHRGEFDLHAMNVPAKQVAGDFFDYFFVDDDVLAFMIADVSGKGAPAALFMAVSRTVLHNQALRGGSPADVLTRANRLIARENDRDMFVTVFLGHYHTKTGRLVYASAGHNPPCVVSSGGGVRRLSGGTGLILGVFQNVQYQQEEVGMDPGDLLVLYTDGVTEALDHGDEQFSLARVEELVSGNGHRSPQEICSLIIQSVESHSAQLHQDDVTLLVLRRNR